jgi:hypothetical protein
MYHARKTVQLFIITAMHRRAKLVSVLKSVLPYLMCIQQYALYFAAIGCGEYLYVGFVQKFQTDLI